MLEPKFETRTGKETFIKAEQGVRIDNIPDSGEQTGWYFIDFHGCWWEYIADSDGERRWIIGDYPT